LDDAELAAVTRRKSSRKTELLLNAAMAIRSSLAAENKHDLGTRLAVRLLVPHIQVDSDVRITAALVDALEHCCPQSDVEANMLIALCRPLVGRKNIRVLDGCVSIALARYHHFLSDERPGGAIHWLLIGMELESFVLGNEQTEETHDWQRVLSLGVCYRRLVMLCTETSQALLQGLLGDKEGVSLLYAQGKEMLAAYEESELNSFFSPAKALELIVEMAGAISEGKDESIVATNIIACLEQRPTESGTEPSLVPASMIWDLLRLAKGILDRGLASNFGDKLFVAAFDVRGMQVLLEQFTIVTKSLEMEKHISIPVEEAQEMRLALAEGLMKAFVAENATKNASHGRDSKVSVAGIYAADLGKHSRETQELVVSNMIDF